MARFSNPTLEELIPGTITCISSEPPPSKRIAIWVDNQRLADLPARFLDEIKLEEGQHVDAALAEQLDRLIERDQAISYMIRAQGRREHARNELWEKAMNKGFNQTTIKEALDDLEKRNLISEEMFAQTFARKKSDGGNWGPVKIRAALKEKGISDAAAEKAVSHIFEEENKLDLMRKQLLKRQRRWKKMENTFERKKKMFDYLLRKGYHKSTILQHIDELLKIAEADEKG